LEKPDLSSELLFQKLKKNSKPTIAVSITDEELSLLTNDVIELIEFIELRVDLCLDTSIEYLSELLKKIKDFGKKIILTVRDPSEGGGKRFEPQKRVTLYKELSHLVDILDIEVSSGLIMELKGKIQFCQIIGTFHDFQKTPSHKVLEQVYERAKLQGADLVKIATKAESKEELRELIRFYLLHPEDTIVMGMGKFAAISRIIMPLLGCKFTYASVGKPKAPGQINVKKLVSVVREIMR